MQSRYFGDPHFGAIYISLLQVLHRQYEIVLWYSKYIHFGLQQSFSMKHYIKLKALKLRPKEN